MKKSYVKPQVYFESFQLSTSIAGTCTPGLTTQASAANGCKVNDSGAATMGLFLSRFQCDVPNDDAGYCYQSSMEGKTLLTS